MNTQYKNPPPQTCIRQVKIRILRRVYEKDVKFKKAQVSVAVSTYAVPSAQSASRCPMPGRVRRRHLVYPQYGFLLGRSFCGGGMNTTKPYPLRGQNRNMQYHQPVLKELNKNLEREEAKVKKKEN